jgi:5-hydroxyisourate hydrolase-like protein (transthyretin family)
MRVNKIVPFSVVILLITVSFAGVAAVSAQSTQTQLSVAANVTTVAANTPFTINGTLNTTLGPIGPGATIQLQNSTNNSTWNNVATNVTDANGNYSFSNNESANGTYYYRTTYAGSGTTYANATSPVVNVTVTKIATQLSVAAPASASAGTSFTINGTLNATSNSINPISGATITLQKNVSGTWNNVATNVTDANGNYSFSNSESAGGTYQYQTTYAGNPTYANATSSVVPVSVGKIPTQLSMAANVTTVPVNESFTINGTLNATSNSINPISGATITLQKNVSGTWNNVATNVTDANGNYSFSNSESAGGTYQYQTTYAGNALESKATSPVVTVQVTQITTQLSAATNLTSVVTNQNFTISGTLLNTTAGISGATIQLQNSTNNSTWNNVNTTTTDTNGNYSFSNGESAGGTYYYRTTYAGYSTYFSAATSPVVTVQVVTPTTLTAAANNTSVAANQNFTISGTLTNTTSGTGISGATITLQKNVSGTWTNVTWETNTTNATGAYNFSTSEPTVATYQYQTIYTGNATYGPATSPVVNVTVATIGTQLSAATNLTSVVTNQNFTINGTLNTTSGTGISGATIQLQNSTNNSTWNNVATNVTDANGNYSFSNSESVNGTYYYRTTYAGLPPSIVNATSNVVNMTVGLPATQLSAVASPTTVAVNEPLTINGTLNTTSGTGISGATIQLQWYSGGTWTNVTGETNTTNATGAYSISTSGPAVGTYQYQTIYAGSGTTYANATSPAVTVQVVIPTTLTAAANVTTAAANTPFTINGTLSFTAGTGIAGATIQLQKNVSGTWTNVATNVTDTNGNYSFSNSESAGGAYYYRTTYAGDPFIGAATSPIVTVTVGTVLIPTQLTAATNLTTVVVNVPFTINGTLNTTSGVGIANATIQLQKNVSGTWTNVAGNINTTTVTGAYRISTSEPTASTYQYRTTYAGNATYKNATSNVVSVNVTSQITPASSPAVTAQNANSLDLFVRGSDNALWYKYWTGTTWTVATSLGGNLTSAPAATSPAAGTIDVFVRGTNGGLYEKTTANNGTSWSGWIPLGGQLASGTGPAADARGLNSLDVFVQGTDHVLYYTHWNGAWSAWKSLGGVLTSSPAATSPSTSVIDVFVSSTNGALWSVNSTNNGTTWNAWKSIGGQLASGTGPAADARGLNSLDVFVQGTDHVLYYTHWNGSTWSAWTSLGGTLAAGSSPAATSPRSGQVDISVLGTGNVLWWKTTTNSGASWSGWMSVGGI